MRRLNLSEHRDSFKKQEAVQEVSCDEPEPPGLGDEGSCKQEGQAELRGLQPGTREQKPLPVPQIDVQGLEGEVHEPGSAEWECQGSYPPLQLVAKVYTEQTDETKTVEYKRLSSQRQNSRDLRDLSSGLQPPRVGRILRGPLQAAKSLPILQLWEARGRQDLTLELPERVHGRQQVQ
ncbi:microtubule-associated serine/threonine-protein kinase 3-like [Macrotis lagotis]|uniref:microtubule-associated serine/threonine-protein kinase 3-like n=1 Tax=Macrotis lagotis TaxID=92651 RepID=UPI003D68A0CF